MSSENILPGFTRNWLSEGEVSQASSVYKYLFLTGMFLNYVHGGVDIVVRLPERGHGVHLVEAHLLQCGDIP